MPRLRLAEPFVTARNSIKSQRQRDRIDAMLHTLQSMPRIGTAHGHRRQVAAFGTGVRRLVVSPYIIVYRYDEREDIVYVLVLIYGPSIR